MPESIWISKDVETVWDFIEMEFAKVFKCSPNKLKNQTMTVKQGKKKIHQKIIVHDRQSHLALLSEDKTNHVETHYKFYPEKEGSFLEMYEIGKGKNNPLVTFYYKITSLPLLRYRKKKRYRLRLESFKQTIENE